MKNGRHAEKIRKYFARREGDDAMADTGNETKKTNAHVSVVVGV